VAQHTYGGVSEDLVGDLLTVSNIDAEPGTRVLEAWVDVPVAARWSLRLGKYDLNTEFDAIAAARLFLSSSQGVGPELSQSGAEGPSIYPRTAFGLRVEHRADVDRIGQYAGLGLVAEQGLLPRYEDTLGIALGYARNGRAWHDAAAAAGTPADAAELAIEVTWRIPVGDHVFVQPDLQYVLNPDTDPSIDDVVGVRIEAAFGYSSGD
jgi:carbohydrate-selective porin OprB